MPGAILLLSPYINGRAALKDLKTGNSKKKTCFNIIFEDNSQIMPEIDDTELLNFSIAFMKIRARELNNNNGYNVKNRKD